ncbi:MAG TPA: GDSL-type esterase/lipase family protein [Pyrinomonadaceae bacterium]|jgi:lysophospholipase L1-like esterase|nr:GDSL-type esterase/lipase family protein [Pyrinomonadaceae bacterium]
MSRNWVFLGDSLTEGVGSKRISHVAELVEQMRASSCANANVHEFRLRHVDSPSFNRNVEFNVAGLMNVDEQHDASDLWLWNLASEGQTIDSDLRWIPLIAALRPELVVIFRGSLESIIRPAMVLDADWPWWVPRSWRGYAAMDPRCYFSTTWWRKAKQMSVDALKQRVRLRLLRMWPGKPLMDLETLSSYQTTLIRRLRSLGTRILVLGLLPVDEKRFPGSAENFQIVNARLQQIAEAQQVEFVDWASGLKGEALFYRDGFHPNAAGAVALAKILSERLCQENTA